MHHIYMCIYIQTYTYTKYTHAHIHLEPFSICKSQASWASQWPSCGIQQHLGSLPEPGLHHFIDGATTMGWKESLNRQAPFSI